MKNVSTTALVVACLVVIGAVIAYVRDQSAFWRSQMDAQAKLVQQCEARGGTPSRALRDDRFICSL